MDYKKILFNIVTRIIGAILGVLCAWLVTKTGIDFTDLIPQLTDVIILAIGGSIGVVGSEGLFAGIRRIGNKQAITIKSE